MYAVNGIWPLSASRRRGRPRICWVDELHGIALRIAGSDLDLSALLNQYSSSSLKHWLSSIDAYFSQSDIS